MTDGSAYASPILGLFPSTWHDRAVRTLVLDESPLFRRQLMVALERQADVEVAAEVSDSDGAVPQVSELAPDVVFLSAQLPPLGGIRTAISLREVVPDLRIAFVVSGESEADLLRVAKAGAIGFAPRDAVLEHAGTLARLLSQGRPVLTARVAAAVRAEYDRFGRQAVSVQQQLEPPTLDDPERRVLDLLAEGRTLTEVATETDAGVATVANLARNCLDKLHRHARTEAVLYAVGSRLFEAG